MLAYKAQTLGLLAPEFIGRGIMRFCRCDAITRVDGPTDPDSVLVIQTGNVAFPLTYPSDHV